LPLGLRCRDALPDRVRLRIEQNLSDNAARWLRVRSAYLEASSVLGARGLDFAVLKGFSMCPQFVESPELRAQYDIDLLFRPEDVLRARDAVAAIGYEPLRGFDRFPLDHLPTMIRKTGWEWRGDYFDPEIPVSLELHFRLWDENTEAFHIDTSQFWERRERRQLQDVSFTALHGLDALAYACLHLLRHLLRGDLRPSHVYELARFLHASADDTGLWKEWLSLHDGPLRNLQAICFALAHGWFECRMAPAARDQVSGLPEPMAAWLAEFGHSPLLGLFHPNKDELWLHLALLSSPSAKAAVLRRRLLPGRLPGPVDAVHIPDREITTRRRIQKQWRYASYLARRVLHHARALLPVLLGGVRWQMRSAGLGRDFWWFFAAASFFNVGLFIFFLLYNLYLLQTGFREGFIGLVSSALTAGSVAGSLGAAFALSRWGLRRTLLACLVVVSGASAGRAVLTTEPLLLGLAFLSGCATATWAVALSPAVAHLTTERSRPLAFSFVFASGIGLGVAGGVLGGRMPGWLAPITGSQLNAYRAALLIGCAIVLLATWPISKLRPANAPGEQKGRGKPGANLALFLIAIAVWHLGTGAFNPFFNTFFARMQMPVSRIGLLFSASQLAQTAAVLLAPLALRKLGLLRGVAAMQLATAAALSLLALTSSAGGAAFLYAAYMSVQYMSEPGMYSYLMDSTPPAGRNTASSLNFVVAFSAQALAAAVAGAAIVKTGYPTVIGAAAILCAIAALLFRFLVPTPSPQTRSDP
jgi:MFS family permease